MKWKYLSNTIIEESEYVPLTHEERGSLRHWLNRLLLNKILRNLNWNILLVLIFWMLRLPSVSIVDVLKQWVNLVHQSCSSDLFTSFILLKKILVLQLHKLVRKKLQLASSSCKSYQQRGKKWYSWFNNYEQTRWTHFTCFWERKTIERFD